MHVLGITDPVTPGRFTTSEPCTEENEADGFLGLMLQVFMVQHLGSLKHWMHKDLTYTVIVLSQWALPGSHESYIDLFFCALSPLMHFSSVGISR